MARYHKGWNLVKLRNSYLILNLRSKTALAPRHRGTMSIRTTDQHSIRHFERTILPMKRTPTNVNRMMFFIQDVFHLLEITRSPANNYPFQKGSRSGRVGLGFHPHPRKLHPGDLPTHPRPWSAFIPENVSRTHFRGVGTLNGATSSSLTSLTL